MSLEYSAEVRLRQVQPPASARMNLRGERAVDAVAAADADLGMLHQPARRPWQVNLPLPLLHLLQVAHAAVDAAADLELGMLHQPVRRPRQVNLLLQVAHAEAVA